VGWKGNPGTKKEVRDINMLIGGQASGQEVGGQDLNGKLLNTWERG
jgi:hypothetical protein